MLRYETLSPPFEFLATFAAYHERGMAASQKSDD